MIPNEFGRVVLFCGTIVYFLENTDSGYTITVKNIDTGEVCSVSGVCVSLSFVTSLMNSMVNGSVTPVTAYDIIRDALCGIDGQLESRYEEICN